MSDRLLLTGLTFFGRHGVRPAEQELGARFVVDVALYTDLRTAGTSDDLAATVDYAAVHRCVRAVIEGPPLRLIEAVAERLATALLAEFPRVERVVVRVHKPQAPIAGAVAVSVAV